MAGRRDRLAGCDRTVAESPGNIGNRQVADTIATIRNDNASLMHQLLLYHRSSAATARSSVVVILMKGLVRAVVRYIIHHVTVCLH